MRTIDEIIKELPVERQKKIAARVKELIAEEKALQKRRKSCARKIKDAK